VKLGCKMGRCIKKVENHCPDVFIALGIMPNCPDIVASAETSFSNLKLIKTFNKSHMTDSRLLVSHVVYRSFMLALST